MSWMKEIEQKRDEQKRRKQEQEKNAREIERLETETAVKERVHSFARLLANKLPPGVKIVAHDFVNIGVRVSLDTEDGAKLDLRLWGSTGTSFLGSTCRIDIHDPAVTYEFLSRIGDEEFFSRSEEEQRCRPWERNFAWRGAYGQEHELEHPLSSLDCSKGYIFTRIEINRKKLAEALFEGYVKMKEMRSKYKQYTFTYPSDNK